MLTNFAARATALVATLPQILKTFAGSAIGGAQILVQKTVAIVQQVVASLGAGDWEGAWNAAVNGTLGPSGIPGTFLNLTTGAGVQTGPIVNPATDIPDNFVPSARTAFQAAQWTARGALQASPSAPAAAIPVPDQRTEPAPAAVVVGETLSAEVEPADHAGTADLADAVAATGATADAGVPSAPADSAAPEEAVRASGRVAAPDRKAAGTGHARRGPAGRAGD